MKTRLREELEYLEEKKQSEMEAKVIMGDEYVEKIGDVNDARKEGLISGMRTIVKRAMIRTSFHFVVINVSKISTVAICLIQYRFGL